MNEKQFNQILIKLSSIEKLLRVMIKINDPDSDHDHSNQSALDHDHDHDQPKLTDEDIISWYVKFLVDNGVDPDHRDFSSKIRNIRYFHKVFDSVTNPLKYQMSFLPRQKLPETESLDEDPNLIFGIDRKLVESMSEKLTPEIINQVRTLCPFLHAAPKSDKKIIDTTMWKNVFTAKAIELQLFTE